MSNVSKIKQMMNKHSEMEAQMQQEASNIKNEDNFVDCEEDEKDNEHRG
jgi:hypothetical protein